ncbi:hypothetical protein HBH70_083710 [Parastagonospora nodorum]|nr:hypothetical protein HBH50_119670 [Parastagonospora nodorum]KAH4100441.1 hypothetical protein HBH48_021210 [Parastagonospora nodorum]KAH4105521.1 hypothetical protein HBH46_084360 [Parastagonospora nodorum]KAH4122335.1 hypothetical protein HBH47_086610 [Parastagonospora nodorum]KAH4213783.1 hypothetical protein HBI95_032570 [Parastagonospora nodorum]
MPGQQQKAHLRARKRRPESTFAFLDPPAELRNKIYEFAFTATDGIKVSWRTGKNRRRKKPVMLVHGDHGGYPINQLQYVNRQLHKEAAGLEIKYDRVTFTKYPNPVDYSGLKAREVFMGSCTRLRRRWITHIALEGVSIPDYTPYQTPLLQWTDEYIRDSQIFAFCQVLPHLRVDYHYPGFAYAKGTNFGSPSTFVTSASIIMRLFRGTDISNLDKHHDSGIMDNSELDRELEVLFGVATCDELKLLATKAPKLRFFPVDKVLPAQQFSDAAEQEWRVVGGHIVSKDSPRDGARLWTAEAQRWIRDGI